MQSLMPNEVTVSLPDCGIKEFWSYKEKELSRQTILKSSLSNRDKFDTFNIILSLKQRFVLSSFDISKALSLDF